MIRGLEPLCCQDRRRESGLLSLERRRLRGELPAPPSAHRKDGERLFRRARSDGTRGNGSRLREGSFRADPRRKSVALRAGRRWPGLPREVGDAPSLGTLEVGSDGARSSPLEAKTSLLVAGARRSLPAQTVPGVL